MTGPPAKRPHHDTDSRGSREKQPRAFGGYRRVPIVSESGTLVEVCTRDRVARYLTAPNAEIKCRNDGSIRVIVLRSAGDDRGHLGEAHGRSTVTTQRVRNNYNMLVGSDLNIEHKKICAAWGAQPDGAL